MIKIDSTTALISGELTTLLSEITTVLRKLYYEMKDSIGEEDANNYLAQVGRMAVMPENELQEYSDANVPF